MHPIFVVLIMHLFIIYVHHAGWFHGDAFGLNAENVSNLIGFKCHNCRKRTPPVCPHFHSMTSDETLIDGVK